MKVKLSLRRIESPQGTYHQPVSVNDDSGRESPAARPDSAILRRKRYRTSKTTTAWVTQANTIHPTKSQKPTIEKLMKLILEQGETIQQQLSKLRDRELQIAKIEEARHRLREKEHGKNYLLETYLNGLHDADDDEKEIGNGNSGYSDSGVHTSEDATTTPEVGISPVHDGDDDFFDGKNGIMSSSSSAMHTKRKTQSKRETKLLREHECSKEFLSMAHSTTTTTTTEMQPENDDADNISGQIEVLEKIVSINKRLQREEELLVRLSAKIRKYESDDPNLTETQIKAAIERVNSTIDKGFMEIQRMEEEFNVSDEMLEVKSDVINRLSEELHQLDLEKADIDLQHQMTFIDDTDHGLDMYTTSTASTELSLPKGANDSLTTNVLGIVMFSVVLGTALGKLGTPGKPLLDFLSATSEAMMIVTHWVIWLSPLGVFFLVVAKIIEMDSLAIIVGKLGAYFCTIMLGLLIHGFGTIAVIFFVCCHKLPYRYISQMGQNLATAFGTGSSSATMPVTINTLDDMGIDPHVTRFVIPVGATVNMDGTALYEAVAAIFIAQLRNVGLSFGKLVAVSVTATAASIGAAGIPSAGLVTMVMVLDTVGLPSEDISLIIAVDWLLDRFRTTINVMCDSLGAILVDHLSRHDLKDKPCLELGEPHELMELKPNNEKEASTSVKQSYGSI